MHLKISDFGPIIHSSVEFNKLTIFIGSQGSGKSTIAKLFSLFMWLEKRLLRGLTSPSQIRKNSTFRTKLCAFLGLSSYFKDSSEIFFEGQHYMFSYRDSRITIDRKFATENLDVYKVMYIPSDRNTLTSLGDLEGLKLIPEYLKSFRDEYNIARKEFSVFNMPFDNIHFEYDKKSEKSWIVGDNYKIKVSDASSGVQAALPLLLVSSYLTRLVTDQNKEGIGHGLNIEEFEKLQKEVKDIINNDKLSSEVKQEALAAVSSKYGYSGFVNIVEEPEQNLYPTSQRDILYDLLRLNNTRNNNKLVITTHSPYIIDYLSLVLKAGEILRKRMANERIKDIVPLDSCMNSYQVNIYQLADGYCKLLEMPSGIPSDSNSLNELLGDTNKTFEELLDIEDSLL